MPVCVCCGNDVAALFVQKRQMCKRCYKHRDYIKKLKETCVSCGKIRAVETRTAAGPVCSSCYARSKPKRECHICHKLARINALTDDMPVCATCYKTHFQTQEICVECGFPKPVEKRSERGPVCKGCYQKRHQPKRPCINCGETRPNKSRGLCSKCYTAHRMATDDNFRLRQRIRCRLSFLLRQLGAEQRHDIVRGLDLRAIAAHLGPCPGDIREYHIDHIRPLVSFDLTDASQIKQAFAPENHQWLRAEDNLKKGAKYAKL